MYASSFEQGFGGKGANQAAAVALHGVGVAWVGCVGDDLFGPETVANLDRRGVDTAHARTITGAATGTALILVEPSGQNRIVLGAGANVALDEAQVHAAFDAYGNESSCPPAVVVGQLETPQPACGGGVRAGARAGCRHRAEPGAGRAARPRLVAACDWLVPNESELAILLGLSADHPVDDALAAGPRLAAELDVGLVVTLGAGGAALRREGDDAVHVAAPRVDALDTTGAGDAFVGCFAAAIARGARPGARWSSPWPSRPDSVTRPGTQASYRARRSRGARRTRHAGLIPRRSGHGRPLTEVVIAPIVDIHGHLGADQHQHDRGQLHRTSHGAAMSPQPPAPDTIVLVHGFWVTPRSWEDWVDPLREQGLHGVAPAYPGLRGRGRGAQRRPDARSPTLTAPADHRAPRVGDRRRSTARRSSSATRPAARSPRCCSTTGTARPASR